MANSLTLFFISHIICAITEIHNSDNKIGTLMKWRLLSMKRKTIKLMSVIFSIALIFSLVPTMATATMYPTVTIGGGSEPIALEVYDSGNIGVFIDEYYIPQQFYGRYDYGVSWFINGISYHTAYLSSSSIGISPDQEGSLGLGTLELSDSGRTATVTWNKDNLIFTTSYTLRPGSRMIDQTWTITNNTNSPISGARLIAGGDTYFAGDDWGYGYWDPVQGACVYRDDTSGLMAFTPVTPVNQYFIGGFSSGRSEARSGELSNFVYDDHCDESYYLQWNYDTIPAGGFRTIRAVQSFAAAGLVTATAPAPFAIVQGQGSTSNFSLTNVTAEPQTVSLVAESTDGITVSFGTPGTTPNAGALSIPGISFLNTVTSNVTIPARSSVNIPVTVTVAGNAPPGAGRVTLRVNNPNGTLITSTTSEIEITYASDWAQGALERADELGLIPGVLVGVDLSRSVTRAEFAAVAVVLYEYLTGSVATPTPGTPFSDVPPSVYSEYVLKAYNIGLVNGYENGTFLPDDLITREGMATLLTRVLKAAFIPEWTLATDNLVTLNYQRPALFADDALVTGYARDSVYFMFASEIVGGVGGNRFDPLNDATREASLMVAVKIVDTFADGNLNYTAG